MGTLGTFSLSLMHRLSRAGTIEEIQKGFNSLRALRSRRKQQKVVTRRSAYTRDGSFAGIASSRERGLVPLPLNDARLGGPWGNVMNLQLCG